jgi:hypothetical protein
MISPINSRKAPKQRLQQLLIISTLVLGLTAASNHGAIAQMSPDLVLSQLPPPAPRTPPPNKTDVGGGLNDSHSCGTAQEQLMALLPTKNPVQTISAHPTILFYIPYRTEDIALGEFSVLTWPDEITRVYRTQFTLLQTSGIASISLPNLPQSALEEGKFYHWYIKLYCQGNHEPLVVHGWIQRVTATPERKQQIETSSPDVWYDSIARLGDRLRTDPQNNELRARWRKLLTLIGTENLAQKSIVGPVQLLENRADSKPISY